MTGLDFACIIISTMPTNAEVDSELEPTTPENVSDKPFIASESAAYSEDAPKRRPGRQRKDGAPQGTASLLAKNVPSPKYTSFYSDHDNPTQKTRAAWTWWKGLREAQRDLLDAHVYRTWPVLLDPIDDSEHKYIDKIIGNEPIQNDQDFIDRWGAGDYTLYLNVTPADGQRRTLFIAYVKCTHDFRKFTPTDRRIDNIANLSATDPANAAYVAWLKANGKLKDEVKETQDMAATAGLTEIVGKALDRGDRLMEKMIEMKDAPQAPPVDPPPSAEEKLNESLTLLEKLQSFTKGSPQTDPLAMMNAVIEAAKTLNQSNSPSALAPFMDRISGLEEKLRTQESEMLRGQLTEIKDQLRALKETPPPSNVLLPDGSNLDSIVKKAVEKAVENGLGGESDNSWWVDPLKQVAPFAIPAIMTGLAQMFMPKPAAAPASSFPMPPQNFQAGGVTQPQAQLPPPAQPQPQPVPQPQQQGASYTTGNPQLDMLLMMIQVPLADHLRDDATGAEFAEYFIENYSFDIHTQLASSGTDAVVGVLYSYPPLAPILKPLARERVVKFVDDFVKFKPPVAETVA